MNSFRLLLIICVGSFIQSCNKDCCDDLELFPLIFEVVDERGETLIQPDTADLSYSISPDQNHHNPSITHIDLVTAEKATSQYFKVYESEQSGIPFVTVESDLDFPSTNIFYIHYVEMPADTIIWEVGIQDETLQVIGVVVNGEELTPARTFRIVK